MKCNRHTSVIVITLFRARDAISCTNFSIHITDINRLFSVINWFGCWNVCRDTIWIVEKFNFFKWSNSKYLTCRIFVKCKCIFFHCFAVRLTVESIWLDGVHAWKVADTFSMFPNSNDAVFQHGLNFMNSNVQENFFVVLFRWTVNKKFIKNWVRPKTAGFFSSRCKTTDNIFFLWFFEVT